MFFWSEGKTFASFSGVSFLKKQEGSNWRNTKILIKNFKFFGFFFLFRLKKIFLSKNLTETKININGFQ